MQFIFTIVYVLEMLSICSVKGIWEYWGDPIHAFDGAVTMISIIDSIMWFNACKTNYMIRILRSLRVFR